MSRVFIGEIGALLQKSDALLTPSDWQVLDGFSSERRRTEQFAWRLLLRRSLRKMGCSDSVIEADIAYNDVGAPYLVDCEAQIGVSHSRSHVAVVISDRPCAVDIELCSRNFAAVERRFLSEEEQELLAPFDKEAFALPIAWAAKEALYKISGVTGLDFVRDVTLLSVDCEGCTIDGALTKGAFQGSRITLQYTFLDDHIVVWGDGAL